MINSPLGPVTFAIKDPLPPGSQYPYRLPRRLFPEGTSPHMDDELEGLVRFSVSPALDDCNPANNTRTKGVWSYQCSLAP